MLKWIIGLLITAAIGVMLLPTVSCGPVSALPAVNARNLRHIVEIIMIHRQQTEQALPDPWTVAGVDFPVVNNGAEAMVVTAAIFEYMASFHDLHPHLFASPWGETELPDRTIRTAKEIVAQPDLRYAEFYALDWTIDKSAGSTIPVVADRFPHDELVTVVYGDGHIEQIEGDKTSRVTTARMNLKPQTSLQWAINDDDIFDTNDKGPFLLGQKKSADVWMK